MDSSATNDQESEKGFLSKSELRAFSWLWRHYLRRFMPGIITVFALLAAHGAALVAFLGLINGSFSELFDPNNGTFQFVKQAQISHEKDLYLDADRDGVYEGELQLIDPLGKADKWVPVRIDVSLAGSRDESIHISDGSTALSKADIDILTQDGEFSVGSIRGLDSLYFEFERTGAGPVLVRLLLILLAATFVRVSTSYVSGRLAARIMALASLNIRKDLITSIFSLDLSYFDRAKSGDIVQGLNGLVTGVQTFFSTGLLNAGKSAISVIGILGYLAWIHFALFVGIVVIVPLAYYGIRAIMARMRIYVDDGLSASANFLTTLDSSVAGIRTIKLSDQTNAVKDTLGNEAAEMARIEIRLARYHTLIAPMIDLLAAFAVMGIVGIGGLAVLQGWGGISAGVLVTFVIGLALVFSPAGRLSGFNAILSMMLVSLKRLHGMAMLKPNIVDPENAVDNLSTGGDIVLRNVSFSYSTNTDNPLFNSLNLTFKGKKVSAIVGQTGSGKTTILSLIARLYEPAKGTVSIGGQDISAVTLSKLRQSFSVVAQDIFLFDDTIIENIRFVQPDATDSEVLRAASKAQLDELILEKENQTVGPRGAQLSGGQRQRIAIARAFLLDAPIVLLDEATSALDQHTEEKITRALKDLCKGKTTIIIAHRLSTITHADCIYVLENGEVAEQGEHEKLLRDGGLYAALNRSQLGSRKVNQTS